VRARLLPSVAAALALVASGGLPSLSADGSPHTPALSGPGAHLSAVVGDTALASPRDGSTHPVAVSRAQAATSVTRVRTDISGALATVGTGAARAAATTAVGQAQKAWHEAESKAAFTPAVRGRVTSEYGPRWGRMHHGIDFGAPHGSALRAVGAGKVTTTSYNSGLGHHVRVRLEDGTELCYGHMSRVTVERGQRVSAGTRLGDVGSSGSSTGAHLHLEVRTPQGERIDPRSWLQRHGIL